MSSMSSDLALARMADFIMWHLRRGKSEEAAVLAAWEHQPELSQSDMDTALEYARRHMMACDIATGQARAYTEWARANPDKCGDESACPIKLHTAAEILRSCGIDCE
jgi:hypothetical protein